MQGPSNASSSKRWWSSRPSSFSLSLSHTTFALLLAVLSALPYLPSMNGSFCYDDKVAVGGNPDVALPNVSISEIFTHDYWGNDILRRRGERKGWTHDSWRPLVTLTFRMNHKMGALNTFAYHVTNVVINAAAAAFAYFVFLLLARMGRTRGSKGRGKGSRTHSSSAAPIAKDRAGTVQLVGGTSIDDNDAEEAAAVLRARLAGLLFSLHPIHSECVANVTSRADPLATLASFAAIVVYLGGRRYSERIGRTDIERKGSFSSCASTIFFSVLRWSFSMFFVLIGLMCKETALTLPVLLAAMDTILSLPDAIERAREGGSGRSTSCCSRCITFLRSLPILRSIFSSSFAAGTYYLRVTIMSRGYSLQAFANEMHNPLANILDTPTRLMAKAYVQSWALTAMAFPLYLSHEHAASKPVLELGDYRNILTVIVYGSVVGMLMWCAWALWRHTNPAAVGPEGREEGTEDVSTTGTEGKEQALQEGQDLAEEVVAEPNPTFQRKVEDAGASSTDSEAKGAGGAVGEDEGEGEGGEDAATEKKPVEAEDASPAKLKRKSVSFAEMAVAGPGAADNASALLPKGEMKVSQTAAGVETVAVEEEEVKAKNVEVDEVEKEELSHDSPTTPSSPDVYLATRLLLGLAWVIITYAPSSHAFLYVAFVVAERTLYFPSFGIVLIVAEAFAAAFDTKLIEKLRQSGKSAVVFSLHRISSASASPLRLCVTLFLFPLLLLYYGTLTGLRNLDWVSEEALLASNLALYPDNNGMAMYGMGAIRLYQGKHEEAEKYLIAARNLTTLAEPHILLGQLYWRYRGDYNAAIETLELIERTSSPRKEILQNLGLLLMLTGRAPDNNVTARQRAEYLVLVGHTAHGYPMSHPNIGGLASNAACVRMTSEPYRYGNISLAEELMHEALTYRHSNRPTAFRNLAWLYAVTGQEKKALDTLAAASSWIAELLAQPNLPPVAYQEAREFYRVFNVSAATIRTHAPLLLRWAEEEGPPVGKAAVDARLNYLGGDCTMDLLFW